ncbi:glycosyltransferase family 2 protein [Anaerostipes butyraticus]|uniref:Glycosyltransferase n=1 Tax=Anaerostipes butyraticus TaxID=645466 RepID=A0A916QB70_9FIRM|nr:glycosyltransferase family 2 protein [Anaerostipes butyraticus]GFO86265.1 glycosyltransferase [Anaerostipes butyraticus]HJC81956.1 glycosyltransferase [Candidatus Anaerostipes avicola]
MDKTLSIVLPSYNEEQMIEKTTETISDIMERERIPYELIFVNDGSKDGTWDKILEQKEKNTHVKGVCFSRNFGKESAISAGLDQAAGACVAVMDCDLQHPPETLVTMYRLWESGFQVIEGIKASRGKESPIYKMFAKTFYKIISNATGIDMSRASDFKLLDRQVVDEYLKLPERNVFFRALSSWVGFKTTYVEFDVQKREAGESKWSFKSLVKYAVNNISAFSAAPMQIVTFFGFIFFLVAVVLGIQSLYMYFSGHAVEGFTTVILLLLFVGSVLMFSLGVIGYYISKIYEEVKMRPRYIISEIVGSDEE